MKSNLIGLMYTIAVYSSDDSKSSDELKNKCNEMTLSHRTSDE
jgi:hypothetical protein